MLNFAFASNFRTLLMDIEKIALSVQNSSATLTNKTLMADITALLVDQLHKRLGPHLLKPVMQLASFFHLPSVATTFKYDIDESTGICSQSLATKKSLSDVRAALWNVLFSNRSSFLSPTAPSGVPKKRVIGLSPHGGDQGSAAIDEELRAFEEFALNGQQDTDFHNANKCFFFFFFCLFVFVFVFFC